MRIAGTEWISEDTLKVFVEDFRENGFVGVDVDGVVISYLPAGGEEIIVSDLRAENLEVGLREIREDGEVLGRVSVVINRDTVSITAVGSTLHSTNRVVVIDSSWIIFGSVIVPLIALCGVFALWRRRKRR
jgi:hypothetical protein